MHLHKLSIRNKINIWATTILVMIIVLSGCSQSKPIKTYNSLESLMAEENIDFLDINNPVTFFEKGVVSKISLEDTLDIRVYPTDNTTCAIRFESEKFIIDVTRYTLESLSTMEDNKSVTNRIGMFDVNYFFEDSQERYFVFGFEDRGYYYKYFVSKYNGFSEQKLVDILYQYIESL